MLSRAYLMIVDERVGARSAAGPDAERAALVPELRRMVDALESVAVFDAEYGAEVPGPARRAAAFVAAEALALLRGSGVAGTQPEVDPLSDMRVYAALESGLLYMIGGYDVNAVAAVSGIPDTAAPEGQGLRAERCRAGWRLARNVISLCRGTVQAAEADPAATPLNHTMSDDLFEDTRRLLYGSLSVALEWYFAWLAGVSEDGAERAEAAVRKVRESCVAGTAKFADSRLPPPYPDVAHLSALLAAAVRATCERSVVHAVPPPAGGDAGIVTGFPAYLRQRARGTAFAKGRPFLWPSTLEYVRGCLPGPERDAVVSMPTGSGKSFLAELAVVHALARGWVVYLAPTNALAHQIRRDLKAALSAFDEVEVTAFVGGEEYTALTEDAISVGASVCVMTPEKCALALRLHPEAFESCSLCVFDECHLLNDRGRGVVADVVLSQLFAKSPAMRVLLMSAMVANPDDLRGWLADVRGHGAHRSVLSWRPSRAARGVAFLDSEPLAAAERAAEAAVPAGVLAAKTDRRALPLGWLMGLSGPWTLDGPLDYRASSLPIAAELVRRRTRRGVIEQSVNSWKNSTGRKLGEMLAANDIPTIDFIMSSRHHAFGLARDAQPVPGCVGAGPLPPIVEAQLAIADAELGVSTVLRDLLRKGVAVHTSAMLQVEQAASERMYAEGGAKLMFATGTLAQGLNLPAAAVVVSGSELGGPVPPDDAAAGLDRANSLILNGFGRAGRPGFANQAVVLLVSDKPLKAPVVQDLTGKRVLASYPVLGEADASVEVHSPIERFIDNLILGDDQGAIPLDLALTTMLSAFDGDVEGAGTLLRRTFGGWVKRAVFGEAQAIEATRRVAEVKREFLERDKVPPWMATAAVKAGVEFFRALRMWQALSRRGLVPPDQLATQGVMGWLDVFLDVVAHMPARRVREYLDDKKTETPRTRLHALVAGVGEESEDDPDWTRPERWAVAWNDLGDLVRVYMQGGTYKQISARLYGTPLAEVSNQRGDGGRGLPPVFKFVSEVVERALAIDAGLLLALVECWLEAEQPEVVPPDDLKVLPLCVRNGCDTHTSLSWFRFGFRQRACAHAFARVFPLPQDATDDRSRAAFVRETRRQWLATEAEEPPGLLDHARVVIKEGSSERA